MVALARHPDLQSRLRAEIRAALPSPPPVPRSSSSSLPADGPAKSRGRLDATAIESLPLLHGICNEVLRLHPVAPVIFRRTTRAVTLASTPVPAATDILIPVRALNRCRGLWGSDAELLRPERWVDDVDGTPRCNAHGGAEGNYALTTFAHGARGCIGQGFARAEIKCLVAAVVGRFEWALAGEEGEYRAEGLLTVKPGAGTRLRMKRVKGW